MRLYHFIIALCLCCMPMTAFGQNPLKPGSGQEQPGAPANADANKAQALPNAAGSAAINHADIQVNQSFVSKTLGNLTLPFMWQIEENPSQKRVVATEPKTETPAILTIDVVAPPPKVDLAAVSQSIADVIAQALGTTATLNTETVATDCGKSKCPSITVYRTQFSGREGLVSRNCALQIVPSNNKLLVLTICAHGERSYSPDLSEILSEVFNLGVWKL